MKINADVHQRKREALPPETVERERRLSICGDNTFQNEVSEQEKCRLFKLPLEIREMIYAELLPFERVWIVIIEGRLACDWEIVKTPTPPPDPNQYLHVDTSKPDSPAESSISAFRRSRQTPLRFRLGFAPKTPIWGLGILPLLQTCRKVYSEVMPYLYSKPDFAFHDTVPFIIFAASIPPSHFQHIRSVTIDLAMSSLPRYLRARLNKAKLTTFTIPRPDASPIHYGFLSYGSYQVTLYNASILLDNEPIDSGRLCWWDAIVHALQEMKSLRNVRITLSDVPRHLIVVGWGDAAGWQRNESDIMDSLSWIGRARPWKGEVDDSDKRSATDVVFENVWLEDGGVNDGEIKREKKKQGYWVRKVAENGAVEWTEVGEAAGKVVRVVYGSYSIHKSIL